MDFLVKGAKRGSGEDSKLCEVELRIEADNEQQAKEAASAQGLLVGSVSPYVPLDVSSSPLIKKFREDFEKAMSVIDTDVGQLIQQRKEMKGLYTLVTNCNTIFEIHGSLSAFYKYFLQHKNVLKRYESERLRQLGHDLIPTYEYWEKLSDLQKAPYASILRLFEAYEKLGYNKTHWSIPKHILCETEYMLDVLTILVEPDFVPLEDNGTGSKESPDGLDRYIPPAVKIAVWRRDQGKCVHCGSREKLEYDHIIPISKGGSNTDRNVQLLCEKCNREKAAQIA